ncbi:condensation domain-containing protein [Streptomyces sp. H10-C2]|uniref:condensation domain-containing protein n=1 Tax=unclassified Streptomyces TaxID=2593676 RepID=UPI0024BA41EA|nr:MULTISPECIES: condensation domain-containing protein [unclassified Streptomyces]MDJ0343476.1 condensation domain-containing protein [Streptomyces sp. PH10-H1]MDJ0371556.1 condensation domain-containing protein [Streptomyces sp. H10-C2]
MTTDSRPTATARQEALLRAARSRARNRPAAEPPAGTPAAGTGPVPLSHAQRRMWLMDRLRLGGALYSVPFATRVGGPLDVDTLAAALTALVSRHEILRTRYGHHEGEPFQQVEAPAPVPVATTDAVGDGTDQLAREAARPFDLAAGPALRVLVLRHAEHDHTVLLTLHHIAVDGGSLETVAAELAELYAAAREGRQDRLEPAPQYAEFARREQESAGRLAEGLEHWARRLAGATPVSLPGPARADDGSARTGPDAARTGPGPAGGTGRTHTVPLPDGVLPGLRTLARERSTTLFTVVLAASFAALHRATGENDLLIGCASSHRTGTAMRGLVGLCVNTLPVRVDLSGDPGFLTLVDRVKEALLMAQEHRDVPFDLIVERLGAAARNADGMPLVRVTADVLREPTVLRLPGTTAAAVDIDLGTTKFDLSFGVEETTTPACLVQHSATALDAGAGARLADGFAHLLSAVAADPQLTLARLPVQPAAAAPGAAPRTAEELLRAHPDVADAVVLEFTDRPPLAWAVPRGVAGAGAHQLRAHLRSALAPSAVPAAVTLLDALPLTPGGTVDTGRLPGLPAPALSPPPSVQPFDTGRARTVLGAFAELLGQEPAPDDDFFALGGHSLMAVQLAERLRGRLLLPLTGLDIMERRTPRALNALLDTRQSERDAAGVATPRPARRSASTREGTVLVTGGTGGVGSFVLRELARLGRPVRALARPESAHRVAADGVEVYEGDLSDLDSLRAACSGVDAVIHAACTFTRPEVDIAAMRVLVDAWRRGPFVFVSSVDAYGEPSSAEVPEGAAPHGRLTPYGLAKVGCERLLMRAAGTEGRGGASAVRSPLVWGAHDRLREQLRWGATGTLFQAALAGEPLVLPDPAAGAHPWYGPAWVHGDALARALAGCLDEPVHGVANAISGHVSWSDLAAELTRLLGSTSTIRFAPDAERDLDHHWHYRADRLATVLKRQDDQDWRTVLAAMTAPPRG